MVEITTVELQIQWSFSMRGIVSYAKGEVNKLTQGYVLNSKWKKAYPPSSKSLPVLLELAGFSRNIVFIEEPKIGMKKYW
jgi:hypothetical protein